MENEMTEKYWHVWHFTPHFCPVLSDSFLEDYINHSEKVERKLFTYHTI